MPEDADQETFTLTLKGAGIDVSRELSANKLALVMSVIMGSDPAEPMTSPSPAFGAPSGSGKVSLREFLDDAKATTKPDQIVAMAHYMAIHEGKDVFSRDDIKARFRFARESLPSNLPRDFSTAVGKGMIAEDHAKTGQYYVTKTGAQAVERRFGASN